MSIINILTDRATPKTEKQLAELISWAIQTDESLELIGHGSKRALGRPLATNHLVDLSVFSGITLYEPNELVLTAGAGTPLAEIDAAVTAAGQHLAFDPIDFGTALGTVGGRGNYPGGTLGGMVAVGLSGPRRIQAGGIRDHVLGVSGVTGRGAIFKTGGRVVKNVTGYDLSKLMTGSYGTLAALTSITIKVLPAPEKTRTLLVFGLNDKRAQTAMTAALSSPHDVTGAAHLPRLAAERSRVGYVKSAATGATVLRIEGVAPSVDARLESLKDLLSKFGPLEELHTTNSATLWTEIRDLALLRDPHRTHLWRLSTTPEAGPKIAAHILARIDGRVTYDWGGGLLWLSIDPRSAGRDGGGFVIRSALSELGGGHATLIRAPGEIRQAIPVFQPQDEALAALTARIKDSFDPSHVLGHGRMYPGV